MQWVDTKSAEARNTLFLEYELWLRKVAAYLFKRYRCPLLEWSDFTQIAANAALQAIERFNPALGVRFESYAYPRIRGAVLNELESFIQDKRIPELYVRQERIDSMLMESYDSEDNFDQIVNVAVGLAFGEFLELGIVPDLFSPDCMNVYQENETNATLWFYVQLLPDKQQQVILYHYMYHFSFVEIAELMKLTKARISQIHSLALQEIKRLFIRDGQI